MPTSESAGSASNGVGRPFRGAGVAMVVALAYPSLLTWVYFVVLAGQAAEWQQGAYSVGKAAQFIFPIALILLVQRRWPAWHWPNRRGMVAGTAFGLAVVAALFGIHWLVLAPHDLLSDAAHEIREKTAGFGIDSVPEYVALALFYSLVHSFLEEYYWRWFVFGQLRRFWRFAPAALLSSIGFMAHHVILLGHFLDWGGGGWSLLLIALGSLSVAVGGAVWAYLYHRTNSLYAPWLSHMIVDAGIFLLGYNFVRPMLV